MSSKLINKLTREFGRNELQDIVEIFFADLIENHPDLDNPEVADKSKQIADYLVNGQVEG